jgi:DNA-directed RNA polymerase specialized sigma24 family protein
VARNKCLEFLRSRKLMLPLEEELGHLDAADGAHARDAESDVIARDLQQRVGSIRDRALGASAARYPEMREFVRLFYDDGLGHRDCARVLSVTERHTKYLNRLFKKAVMRDPLWPRLAGEVR